MSIKEKKEQVVNWCKEHERGIKNGWIFIAGVGSTIAGAKVLNKVFMTGEITGDVKRMDDEVGLIFRNKDIFGKEHKCFNVFYPKERVEIIGKTLIEMATCTKEGS